MSMSIWLDQAKHYEFRSGSGYAKKEVVVFVHALGFDMTTWDSLWRRLAQQHSVLRYNQIGHGGREYQPSDSVHHYVRDLSDLLQLLEIESVHIIGHGVGGNLGLLFSIAHPHLVRSLTLISTHLVVSELVYNDMSVSSRKSASDDTLDRVSAVMAPLVCIDEGAQFIVREAFKKISPNAYFHYLNNHAVQEYNEIARKNTTLSTPILQLVGEFDALSPTYIYGITTTMFVNARFLVIRDASHAVHMDRPEAVANEINLFINNPSKKSLSVPVMPSTLHEELVDRYINNPLKLDQLKIQFIGDFSVWINGVQITGSWNMRKARQLLSYLVFNPVATRDRLCDEFWPDYDFERAHHSLRVSLHYLRTLLESEFPQQTFLQVTRQSVSLKGNIVCDVVELLYTLQHVNEEPDFQMEIEVIRRVMHQMHPESLVLYDDELWFRPIRIELESRFITAMKRLGDHYFEQGQYGLAVDAWENGLRFDEFDLTLYHRVIDSMECLKDETGMRLWSHRRDQIGKDLY